MKILAIKNSSRLLVLAAASVLAIGVGGCGRKVLHNISEEQYSAGVEPYFNVGAVTYQVQVSRQLNPFDADDVQYLAGVKGAQDLAPDQLWYGVFLWAKNQSKQTHSTADKFEIVDSEGTVYKPTVLNPSINPYAWTKQALSQNSIEPGPDTTASQGSTGGGLILFKLNDSIYSNRPLTLEIFVPGQKTSKISLDL